MDRSVKGRMKSVGIFNNVSSPALTSGWLC
jgi:hypothetical protein